MLHNPRELECLFSTDGLLCLIVFTSREHVGNVPVRLAAGTLLDTAVVVCGSLSGGTVVVPSTPETWTAIGESYSSSCSVHLTMFF